MAGSRCFYLVTKGAAENAYSTQDFMLHKRFIFLRQYIPCLKTVLVNSLVALAWYQLTILDPSLKVSRPQFATTIHVRDT